MNFSLESATIGPAMAVALLTTFYGAVLANLIFLPISGKLRLLAEEQALLATISIEGILSLARQENSIVLEQRLHSFLPVAVGA